MPKASAAQLEEQVALPTRELNSAPGTETTITALANVLSWHQEVLTYLPVSLLPSCLVKHFYASSCKYPGSHFIFPLCWVTAEIHFQISVMASTSSGTFTSDLPLKYLACFPHCRLVVWGLWSVKPEWHLLPGVLQCDSLQWHQMVLLEGSKCDGYYDNHDGATSKALMALL